MEKGKSSKVFVGADRIAVGRSSVQRGAHEVSLPQQAAEWQGAPTSYEGANATESVPQHALEVGGRSPADKRSAAGRCVHHLKVMAERSEEVGRPARGLRQQTQAKRWRRHLAAKPAQRPAALCAGGPEGGIADRWKSVSSVRQTESRMQGVQPCKSSGIHDSGSTAGRLDGADLCAQDACFSASGAVTQF